MYGNCCKGMRSNWWGLLLHIMYKQLCAVCYILYIEIPKIGGASCEFITNQSDLVAEIRYQNLIFLLLLSGHTFFMLYPLTRLILPTHQLYCAGSILPLCITFSISVHRFCHVHICSAVHMKRTQSFSYVVMRVTKKFTPRKKLHGQ